MYTPFSLRHRPLLESQKIQIKVAKRIRSRLTNAIRSYDESYETTNDYGSYYWTSIFENIKWQLLKYYGGTSLKAYFNENYIDIDDFSLYLDGCRPEYVLDLVEMFERYIDQGKRGFFKDEINQIFKTENCNFRLLDGEIIIIDSEFAESEILSKTLSLLESNGFAKAQADFKNALSRLSADDYVGCIIQSNNAIESLLMKITNEKGESQGALKKALIKQKLIPEYFTGFVEHFEKLLQSAFTIANKSARHGNTEIPKPENQIDKNVANFTINLLGSLLIFIVERYCEQNPVIEDSEINQIGEEDDLPF